MKPALLFAVVCAALLSVLQSRATTLQDACGDDKVKFNVTSQKDHAEPRPPADGQAQVVFVEQVDASEMGGCIGCNIFTTRIGMDGSWVGAARGNTYFTLDIAPGEHHFCAYWKSIHATGGKNIGIASISADAGKVYYFQVTIKDIEGAAFGPPRGHVSTVSNWTLDLTQLRDDEGRYRVKSSALATSVVKN